MSKYPKSKLVGIVALIVTLAMCGPVAQAQQQAKLKRIGYLALGADFIETDEFFRQGLQELGYAEGRNIVIDFRGAEGKADRFPELAAELVRSKVDVMVATTLPAALAAKQATTAIPIVFVTGDPVRTGLVASLARPRGKTAEEQLSRIKF